MTNLDWFIVSAYVIGMIGLSVFLARGQKDDQDYYVGGRNLPWWAVGISVVATQSSAISFISIPAFVALREGGGLSWLQYELAVPLAMIFIMFFLVPYFRKLKLVSVFQFLEMRFGEGTSRFLSFVFLISRGFGTGIGVYATALVLAAMLDWSLTPTILLIGVTAIIYDAIGGIKAVVISDVIQLTLIVLGSVLAIYYAIDVSGGLESMWSAFSPERRSGLEPSTGLGTDQSTVPFWAFLIGGFFLYSSYYGTDQSQVQRALSTKSTADTRRSLLLNGLGRLPLTLLYLVLGVSLAGAYAASPDLQQSVPSDRLDFLVPQFILLFLPSGVKGLILAAVLAAAMSSLDSAINSLSAVTMRDYIEKHFDLNAKKQLLWGKATTVAWGVLVTALAFVAGGIDKTVVEAINKVGSAFYGPVLAAFFLGVVTRKIDDRSMWLSVLLGVSTNVTLWTTKAPVHWMWWNAIGFFLTIFLAYILKGWGLGQPKLRGALEERYSFKDIIKHELSRPSVYVILLGYFLLILALIGITLIL